MNAHLFPFTDPVQAQAEPPNAMVSSDGIRVTNVHGQTYVDAVSGLWCASLGFSPARLQKAASDQMGKLGYHHSFMGRTCDVTNRLAETLAARLPGDLNHVFFGTAGSEAVETAAKFARFYQNGRGKPGKKKIIARENAYHGSCLVSAALTGMSYCHEGFDVPLNGVVRINRPHYFVDGHDGESEAEFAARRVAELEETILREGADTIAAMIGEPVIGSGGVMLPPQGYWAGVQEVLKRHDILLIADEIITGFGRTGEWFACETYGIRPDMMTMAKQMTGAVFPMSAVAMTPQVRDGLASYAHELGTLGHGVTYGGHPVGAAVALETMAIYEEMDLPRHVQALGAHLTRRMAALANLPGVADLRAVGLLAGVEFVGGGPHGDALAQHVCAAAERRGVLFRTIGNALAISPAYIVTEPEIDMLMEVMRDSILEVAEG